MRYLLPTLPIVKFNLLSGFVCWFVLFVVHLLDHYGSEEEKERRKVCRSLDNKEYILLIVIGLLYTVYIVRTQSVSKVLNTLLKTL